MQLPARLLYLTPACRARLETLRDACQWADELASDSRSTEGYYYRSSYGIALAAREDVREIVAALLTDSGAPEVSNFYIEIEAALSDLYRDMENEYSQMRGEPREAEVPFMDSHPDVKRRIERKKRPY